MARRKRGGRSTGRGKTTIRTNFTPAFSKGSTAGRRRSSGKTR